MLGAVDSIETFGLVDGPGIRTVVFLSGCTLRCKYCHNPEMWVKGQENYSPEELAKKIMRNKPYFKDDGGVTFSGGEPLLQAPFVIEVCKILKRENIHIALDTAGVGLGNYEEILSYVDLVLLDIKHLEPDSYEDLTGAPLKEYWNFVNTCQKMGKKLWLRQVVVPGVHDNPEYMLNLRAYIKTLKNVVKIEFLPFHRLGREKYLKLGIPYPYEEKGDMDAQKCLELYQKYMPNIENLG